jgi:hypothetical protein
MDIYFRFLQTFLSIVPYWHAFEKNDQNKFLGTFLPTQNIHNSQQIQYISHGIEIRTFIFDYWHKQWFFFLSHTYPTNLSIF